MLVGISIFFLVKNLNKENVEGKINQENQGVAEKEKLNTETNNKIKTIEEMLSEFGGEILEQVNSKDAKIVVVTDRIDLDSQIHKIFNKI